MNATPMATPLPAQATFREALSLQHKGLQHFIPPVLLRWPEFIDTNRHQVATLFIDVAGFTTISEVLTSIGLEGGEILERAISNYFNRLLDVIDVFQGIPIKVAGDSLTVIFDADRGNGKTAAQRALACASLIRMPPVDESELRFSGHSFRLEHKIGVGYGSLTAGVIGNPRISAELVYTGAALCQAAEAEHRAGPGEVVASPQVVSLIDRPELWDLDFPKGYRRLDPSSNIEKEYEFQPLPPLPTPGPAQIRNAIEQYSYLIPTVVKRHAEQGALDYLCRHQHLTVLFAGYTGMPIDGDEAIYQLDTLYRQTQQLVSQYGGHLSEFEAGDKGPKLIVLFGAPNTLEDPCGQAARCALALREAARDLDSIETLSIGLSTGPLYVGRIGCRNLVKYSALGDRMNLAARLMTRAEPWSVIADRHTVERSAQAVRWDSPSVIRVKGRDEKIAASRLQLSKRERRQEQRGRGLVGRQPEREIFRESIERLMTGQGGIIQLSGDAGIGKTRLLELLRRQALGLGIRYISQWIGTTVVQAAPLNAWVSFLLEEMGADEHSSAEVLNTRFEIWHSGLPKELKATASLLASLVGATSTPPPELANVPSEQLNVLCRGALSNYILANLGDTPRVLLIDDGEKVDGPSLELLNEVAPFLPEIPLLIVLAHRDDQATRNPYFKALQSTPTVQQLKVEALEKRESEILALKKLRVRQLDEELAELLHRRAAGNPMLLEAWIDALREGGLIATLDDVAYLAGSEQAQVLPDRLEALILVQLERLPPSAQLTVRVASVVGQQVVPQAVQKLHPEAPSLQQVEQHLKQAAQTGLLRYERGNPSNLFFTHVEVREAIHDSLPFVLRRTLHSARASQLRQTLSGAPDDDMSILLAQHYEYIHDQIEQKSHFLKAAHIATKRCDFRGTVHWANRYLQVCQEDNDMAGPLLVASDLQRALTSLGETEARRKLIERWIGEAEQNQDAASLVEALIARAQMHQWHGDTDQACLDLEKAMQHARAHNDRQILTDALISASTMHASAGRSQLALSMAEEAIRNTPARELTRLSRSFHNRGFALEQMGRSFEAYRTFVDALELYESAGNRAGKVSVLGNIGVTLWSMGQPEKAHAHLVQALELSKQVAKRRQIGLLTLNVGESFLHLGDLKQSGSHVTEALRILSRVGYVHGEGMALSSLGQVYWLRGKLEKAEALYQRNEQLLMTAPNPLIETELRLLHGELKLSRGNGASALADFRQARNLAVEHRLTGLECHAHEGLAESYRKVGKLKKARQEVELALQLLQAVRSEVNYPRRIWWRAARIAMDMKLSIEARALKTRARRHLENELSRLKTRGARQKLVAAFPWNRAIMRHSRLNLEIKIMSGREPRRGRR